jgi:flagellar hook-associated protein 2
MGAINNASIGVNASIVQDSKTGLYHLSLESGTAGTAGTLTVTSSILDTNTVGVTAGVSTVSGQSNLTLTSGTSGANGDLTVTSALTANTPTALSYADTQVDDNSPDSGTLGPVASSADVLAGSITVQVGSGSPQTITLDSTNNTLAGLIATINSGNFGFTAAGIPDNNNPTSLSLTSGTAGASGALTVTTNIGDTSDIASSKTLNYNSSSDITSLTSLGISVNNDGSLTFDASSLDALLNTDFNGVVGLFQNVDSWGQNFASMLNNASTSSSTGILKLAQNSNSAIESSLNAEVSKEDAYIATQQKNLTAELNSANEIMQQLPSQLQGMNELYAAITGYNQNSNS